MTQHWERILTLWTLQPICQNLQVTKSQELLTWYLRESGDFGNGSWAGTYEVTTLIAKQGFMCSSPVGQLIGDTFVDPVDFLVLPTKSLCCALLPVPTVPSCLTHDTTEPERL